MEELERLNQEIPINIINNNEDIQNKNQLNIREENDDFKLYKEFLNKVDNKKIIEITDFNLYKKIKTDNQISPLMIYILSNAIDKYNDKSTKNGIDEVDLGYIKAVTSDEEETFEIHFGSKEVKVLYASFSEDFIGNFWKDHPLLSDLLGVNPDNTVLSSKLKLGKSKLNKSESSQLNQQNISSISDEDKKLDEINNKEYYKLSLGANFEYNALHFLFYGIEEFTALPRIIYYPIVKFMDYEEIDSAFILTKMKENIEGYYSNFKSIDINQYNNDSINLSLIDDYNKIRKEFKLNINDIVFVETTFDFDTKRNKVEKFFQKIIKFISLYINKNKIDDINNYTIRPILLYNNNFNLNRGHFKDIKSAIESIKTTIQKNKDNKLKTKLCEIYNNFQIIYCWPTIPVFNNYTTYKELNSKIQEYRKENEQFKKENEQFRKDLEKKGNDIQELKEMISKLENKNNYYNSYNNKRFNNNRYYNHNNYKYFNYQSNYHKKKFYKYNDNRDNVYKKNDVNNNYHYKNNYY